MEEDEAVAEKMEAAQKDNSFQKFGGERKGNKKEVTRKGVEGRGCGLRIEETWVCLRAGGEH